MTKVEQIMDLLIKDHEKEVEIVNVTAYGYQFNYNTDVIGCVSRYWFGKHEVIEHIAPLNSESENQNRPGTLKPSTEYVTVHDTASAAPTADAYRHAQYVSNGGGGTSWHYSSGSDGIYHQIPDNEVAYHAGDGTRFFNLLDTGVKYEHENPKITIGDDHYYYLDNKKTLIKVPEIEEGIYPTTDMINDYGIIIEERNHNYWMGETWYSPSYKKVANFGGNRNSIGIETMVNQGSNLSLTWHKTAKLVAHLLKDNNLTPNRVKAHHYFSGKDCPMTMRRNHSYWEHFLSYVKAEYDILMLLDDSIQIKFTFLTPDLLDDTGMVKEAKIGETVSYNIVVTDGKNTKEVTLSSKIVRVN